MKGPQIPDHILKKRKEEKEGHESNTIGSLGEAQGVQPKEEAQSKKEQPKTIMGPERPENVAPTTDKQSLATETQSPAQQKKILGPRLPPHLLNRIVKDSDQDTPDNNRNLDDNDSEGEDENEKKKSVTPASPPRVIKPRVGPAKILDTNLLNTLNEQGELEQKRQQMLGLFGDENKSVHERREEWMKVLPEGRSLANMGLSAITSGGSRQFSRRGVGKVDSSWAETPGEETSPHSSKDAQKNASYLEKLRRDQESQQTRKALEGVSRGPSLLEKHQEALKKQKKSGYQPMQKFNKDEEFALHRPVDSETRQKMINDAKNMGRSFDRN